MSKPAEENAGSVVPIGPTCEACPTRGPHLSLQVVDAWGPSLLVAHSIDTLSLTHILSCFLPERILSWVTPTSTPHQPFMNYHRPGVVLMFRPSSSIVKHMLRDALNAANIIKSPTACLPPADAILTACRTFSLPLRSGARCLTPFSFRRQVNASSHTDRLQQRARRLGPRNAVLPRGIK